jgi:hypothetical protein
VLFATKYGDRWASPRSALTSPFPARLRGFPPAAVVRRFRSGFILSYTSRRLQSPPCCCPPFALRLQAPPLGFLPSSRHQLLASTLAGVPSPLVPSTTFLTSSTASSAISLAGLFHPAATSRVRSSRAFPLTQPYELSLASCPLVVSAAHLPTIARELQYAAYAFRAFLCARVRCWPRLFKPPPARSPPELLPPSGLSPHTVSDAFTPLSALGLSWPPACRRCAARLTLAGSPPRSRFLTCRPNVLPIWQRGPTFITRSASTAEQLSKYVFGDRSRPPGDRRRPLRRLEAFARSCPVTRSRCLSWSPLRFRVLYATKYGNRWASSRSALAFTVSGSPLRSSSGRRPPSLSLRVHPLVRSTSPPEYRASTRPLPFGLGAPPLGFLPSSRHQLLASTLTGIPSPLRSVHDVSHVLDGFLRHQPCGSISPRNHVQGSLFRGFPSHTAARAFARRCPRVVSAAPLPTIARQLQGPTAAFRAFLCARVRCPPQLFRP